MSVGCRWCAMDPRPADRGQANLVGFILVFGFLLVSYSLFQAYVIPNQNAEIEYQHYQDTRSDMTDLYAEIVTLGESSSDRQLLVPVDLGMDYPSRLLFLNPPPAAGSIRSTEQGSIQIGGANATEICGGDDTTGLVYSPGYHVSTQPDIRYDNGLLYIETANDEYAMLERRPLVANGEINLYRLSGELRTQSGTDTLPIELTGPGSAGSPASGVSVTNITLQSGLPASEWNESEALSAGLSAVDAGDNRVRIEGFSGTYDIECHPVGLGQRP